jgi:SAM-dependent methyltransferase
MRSENPWNWSGSSVSVNRLAYSTDRRMENKGRPNHLTDDDGAANTNAEPWQLRMFRKTLKKRQRLRVLRELLGALGPEDACLLVTCGDNNGAINYHLRESGGVWTFADADGENVDEMAALLDQHVHAIDVASLPFGDASFTVAVAIDVHEHIKEPEVFTAELSRILRPGGRLVITVPGGDPSRPVNRLKKWLGMTKKEYGHVSDGYGATEIEGWMQSAGVAPEERTTFSRFFTELIELGINVGYVKLLSRRGQADVPDGTIAPQSREQLRSVEKTYRAYALVYPIIRLVASLDVLFPFSEGYVVMVTGRKN